MNCRWADPIQSARAILLDELRFAVTYEIGMRLRGCDFRNLRDIAQHIGMSPTDLDSIATFYNLIYRRPVGRHVISVCDSVSCWIMGCEPIREHLQQRLGVGLGGTTPDDRFTLLPTVCLGCCDRAPAMMIDGDLHTGLDPLKIDTELEKYK